MNTENKISTATIITTVGIVLALANQVLLIFGKSPIPITDDQTQTLISTAITVITSLIAWWRNNSFTKAARAADQTMKQVKEEEALNAKF